MAYICTTENRQSKHEGNSRHRLCMAGGTARCCYINNAVGNEYTRRKTA